MPSPFPGMDPFLESPSVFPDLHNRLIAAISDDLNARLPAPYFTAIANRVWVEASERLIEPDVNLLRPRRPVGPDFGGQGGGVALAEEVATEPLVVHAPLQATQTREWYLELHADPGGERLVTLIELLSPSNKRAGSAGRAEYRRKQAEALAAAVHLVEIDLLRGGAHTTAVPELRLRERVPAFDYHACIRRFDRPDDFLIYPWQLPDRLPILAIPLLPGTPDVPLDLRTLLARVYDTGRYDRRIDYRARAFDPPLTPERVAWLGQVLPAAPQV